MPINTPEKIRASEMIVKDLADLIAEPHSQIDLTITIAENLLNELVKAIKQESRIIHVSVT